MRELGKPASVWLVVISLLMTATACNLASASAFEEASSTINEAPQHGDNIVRVTGTVIYLTLEGGCWGIEGDDGKYYRPGNLPQELKRAGIRAEFELEILEDVASFCPGIAVEVLDYGAPGTTLALIHGIVSAVVAAGLLAFFLLRRRIA